MGRPRVKVMDDSQTASPSAKATGDKEAKKIASRSFGKKGKDTLVESLKEELGISEQESGGRPEGAVSEQASGVADRSETKPSTKSQKQGKAKPKSKKYQESIKSLEDKLKSEDADENYSYKQTSYKLPDAIDMVKKLSYSKFTGTLEAHINTFATGLRGFLQLPFASGHKIRILAFGEGAKDSGADILGDDRTLDEISKGKIDFDLVVTTPDWMPKLAKVAKNLRPRGLMPNPKNGTITNDLKKTVQSYMEGKTEYKTESKAPIIHLGVGKLDQPNEELEANVKTLVQTLGKTRIKKITLSPTMGASVKIDL